MSGTGGLSGAYIAELTPHVVRKGGGARVAQQGRWLAENACEVLPRVYTCDDDGYTMERLRPMPVEKVDLERMAGALRQVWSGPARVTGDSEARERKLCRIAQAHAPHLEDSLVKLAWNIPESQPVRTHGDPTAENVMQTWYGKYVLIDPIPASPEVPDEAGVDVGKILQSAVGWESWKVGAPQGTLTRFTPEDVLSVFGLELFAIGMEWLVVHLARTLPYVPEEVKPRVLDYLNELLGV